MTVPRALPSGEPVVGTNQVWHQLYACDGFTARRMTIIKSLPAVGLATSGAVLQVKSLFAELRVCCERE